MVRAESFTRLPTPQHASTAASYSAGVAAVECSPNTTGLEVDVDTVDSESEELLATTQHSSYSAALGVTVGVGCLLLVLNMLIFAGIYYQRERRHKSALPEDIPLSQLTPNVIKVDEPPPRYPSADAAGGVVPLIHKGACPPPTPPVRTSSNPSTVKKRVHIQEISV